MRRVRRADLVDLFPEFRLHEKSTQDADEIFRRFISDCHLLHSRLTIAAHSRATCGLPLSVATCCDGGAFKGT